MATSYHCKLSYQKKMKFKTKDGTGKYQNKNKTDLRVSPHNSPVSRGNPLPAPMRRVLGSLLWTVRRGLALHIPTLEGPPLVAHVPEGL